MSKTDWPAFVKCFAGVYQKHAKRVQSNRFTCYVRDAVRDYIEYDDSERREAQAIAAETDEIGYRVARALLVQGFGHSQILRYVEQMQDVVDTAERASGGDAFADLLREHMYDVEYPGGWESRWNYLRWEWMRRGCPDLGIEEYEPEYEDDEDDEDDED